MLLKLYFTCCFIFCTLQCPCWAITLLKSFVKYTNIKCKTFNSRSADFEKCYVEQYQNSSKVIVLSNIYQKPVTKVQVHVELFRQPTGHGYFPYIVDLTFDWCDFIVKRNIILMDSMFALIAKFTNFNKKCPLNQDKFYMNITLPKNRGFILPFRFPPGDYRIDVNITGNEDIQVIVNSYLQIDW